MDMSSEQTEIFYKQKSRLACTLYSISHIIRLILEVVCKQDGSQMAWESRKTNLSCS